MIVIAWIAEGTWPACVDAARAHAPERADVVLLHVTSHDAPAAAHGAYAGLFGRGHPERDPGTRLQELAAESAQQLQQAAAERLGRPSTRLQRTGRIEREVVAVAPARAAGYAGSARTFRRLVAESKRAWRQEHHRGDLVRVVDLEGHQVGDMWAIDAGDPGAG